MKTVLLLAVAFLMAAVLGGCATTNGASSDSKVNFNGSINTSVGTSF